MASIGLQIELDQPLVASWNQNVPVCDERQIGVATDSELANQLRTLQIGDIENRLDVLTQRGPDTSPYEPHDPNDLTDNLALAVFNYSVRADGRRTSVTETLAYDTSGDGYPDFNQVNNIDWFYDNLGRLTREIYDSSNDALDFAADYLFDLVGNRLRVSTIIEGV